MKFSDSGCTRSIQCLFRPGSWRQNTSVCTALGVLQVQPSSERGKCNLLTVDVQGLSSVYSAPIVDCKIPTFVQRWMYCKPNLLPTVEKVIFRQWMYKVYSVSIPLSEVGYKILGFVQRWVYSRPNLIPTVAKVMYRQWMYKVYSVSIPPR